MLTVIRKPMFNGGGREYYLALKEYPEVPINTPRVGSLEELIAALENMVLVAKEGPIMEVKR
jgi:hypothetical protein